MFQAVETKAARHYTSGEMNLQTDVVEETLEAAGEGLGFNSTSEARATQRIETRRPVLSGSESQTNSHTLPPGFLPNRFVTLMRRSIAATGLDLSGINVLTEAASGAYGATAVVAAMAGARHVDAVVRESRFGSIQQVGRWMGELAHAAGVADRISIVESISDEMLGRADILTNSGHLRPLSAEMIAGLPPGAVIALMFEAWEFRPKDVDAQACRLCGIPIVGVNERHPQVDVFSFLGPLCVKELHDCGVSACRDRIALICDNAFADFIARGLRSQGADVTVFANADAIGSGDWDAVVLALQPSAEPKVGAEQARHLAGVLPAGTAIVQFWGDMDRTAFQLHGLPVWPPRAPAPGHMAVLLSEIGPEPVVRLQTGGLRAAELVWRGIAEEADGFAQIVETA